MPVTNYDIASRALALLGEPPITSFSGGDTEDKVGQIYETSVLYALSMREWNFATVKALLNTNDTSAPAHGWDYAYALPALGTTRVGQPIGFYANMDTGAPRVSDFEISQEWVYTNRTEIAVEYVSRISEDKWPGFFVRFMIEVLAADLALPITENASKADYHRSVAFGMPSDGGRGGMFRVAMQADEFVEPAKSLLDHTDPITEARF